MPGGRASTSTPVVSQLPGSVSTSRPSPPGKSRANTRSNAAATSAYASAKTCSTRASTSAMMSSRSLRVFRRSSSCSERNRCRSSIASNSSSASGLTRPSSAELALGGPQPLLLLLSDVGHRVGVDHSSPPRQCLRPAALAPADPARTRPAGPRAPSPSSAIARSSSASTRIRCSALANSSRWAASTSDSKSRVNERTDARAAPKAASASLREASASARSRAARVRERSRCWARIAAPV